jgi:UDP-N-acetylglucosamine 1-carboxyvinyltransferase
MWPGNKCEKLTCKHLRIMKSGPLYGSCDVSTSKNAILPKIAASLLTKERVIIRNVPKISDVADMIELLGAYGAEVILKDDTLYIRAQNIATTTTDESMAGRLRASFLFMGPLLAREGCVTMPMPGGCRIGLRPIDLHLKGLTALGASTLESSGHVRTWAKKLSGTVIYLDYPSVGATENIVMAACLAEGRTIVKGAAVEPEVVDLIAFLNSMGAEIKTENTCITIVGKKELHGTDYSPIPDRIEAGTLMLAAAVTGGDVMLKRANIRHLGPVTSKLMETGAEVFPYPEGVRVRGSGASPLDIISSPYPGFPTDMQAQFMAACCAAKGISTISETVFENRFLHVAELKKMGADIMVNGNKAIVKGTGRLHGAKVSATDLRAGAALCIAALIADEETVICDIYHLDRGYDDFAGKLKKLGANIERVE